jgi:hypothetical protein
MGSTDLNILCDAGHKPTTFHGHGADYEEKAHKATTFKLICPVCKRTIVVVVSHGFGPIKIVDPPIN